MKEPWLYFLLRGITRGIWFAYSEFCNTLLVFFRLFEDYFVAFLHQEEIMVLSEAV